MSWSSSWLTDKLLGIMSNYDLQRPSWSHFISTRTSLVKIVMRKHNQFFRVISQGPHFHVWLSKAVGPLSRIPTELNDLYNKSLSKFFRWKVYITFLNLVNLIKLPDSIFCVETKARCNNFKE